MYDIQYAMVITYILLRSVSAKYLYFEVYWPQYRHGQKCEEGFNVYLKYADG